MEKRKREVEILTAIDKERARDEACARKVQKLENMDQSDTNRKEGVCFLTAKKVTSTPIGHVFNVGQGSCSVIFFNEFKHVFLLDAGCETNESTTQQQVGAKRKDQQQVCAKRKVEQQIGAKRKDQLDIINTIISRITSIGWTCIVVLSHAHKDHTCMAAEILKALIYHQSNISVKAFFGGKRSHYKSLVERFSKQTETLEFGFKNKDCGLVWKCFEWQQGHRAKIFRPFNGTSENFNDHSLVFRAQFSHVSVLISGDATEKTFNVLKSSDGDMASECQSTVFVADHHGSSNHGSNGIEWLRSVAPYHVVFSAGMTHYLHPHKSVIEKLFRHINISNGVTHEFHCQLVGTDEKCDSNSSTSLGEKCDARTITPPTTNDSQSLDSLKVTYKNSEMSYIAYETTKSIWTTFMNGTIDIYDSIGDCIKCEPKNKDKAN